ncbi:MAG: GNAT family N-acetyltransferase [Patescibacteria group bacterium]|nr:GNAT family N-acetyltransferase [Patescibacteria group bacterium]
MLKIRKAKISDSDKILKILRQTPELQGSRHHVDAEYTKNYVTDCIRDTRENCVLVAVDGKEIIGVITLEIYLKKKFSHLTDIAIVSGYRRKGIGGQLYQACEKILKKKKINAVAGITQADNKIMRSFCAKHQLDMGKEMYYFEKKLK